MGRPLRIEYHGAYYHVTSRGNERKDVFKSQNDREQFLRYLESAVTRYDAVIHAYCLMSNHYHLLLETPSGNLSKIMQQSTAPTPTTTTPSGSEAATSSRGATRPLSWKPTNTPSISPGTSI